MRGVVRGALLAGAGAAVATALTMAVVPMAGQTPATVTARTAEGRPNLNGVWQALNTANWDIQDHAASMGPAVFLGAAFSVPGGMGVVEGNEIPYQPWAAAKKQENARRWWELDPEVRCYRAGVPRANYQPYPFQITQTGSHVVLSYEFASASRIIYMTPVEDQIDSWFGTSNGRWEGDTLVVETTGFNGQTWFDRAGNFHSEALKTVERYTPLTPYHLTYEVTIEDPKVFTRPWTMRMPLYRRMEPNAQILEYKCVEFAEELIYGHLVKQPSQ
jgi:hypothetical protein